MVCSSLPRLRRDLASRTQAQVPTAAAGSGFVERNGFVSPTSGAQTIQTNGRPRAAVHRSDFGHQQPARMPRHQCPEVTSISPTCISVGGDIAPLNTITHTAHHPRNGIALHHHRHRVVAFDQQGDFGESGGCTQVDINPRASVAGRPAHHAAVDDQRGGWVGCLGDAWQGVAVVLAAQVQCCLRIGVCLGTAPI